MLQSPAVRTLSRYLVARFVQLFLVVVVVAVLSISVIELLLNLDRMMGFGGGLGGALDFLWLRLASEYASYIVPLAAFLAGFSTAALSAYAREWLALRAGGIGLLHFIAPLLACGGPAGVEPASRRRRQHPLPGGLLLVPAGDADLSGRGGRPGQSDPARGARLRAR